MFSLENFLFTKNDITRAESELNLMHQTLKGALKKPNILQTKLTKKLKRIYKKNAKKLVSLSIIAKLVLLSVPVLFVPALAQGNDVKVSQNTNVIELSKNESVFGISSRIEFKPVASNYDKAVVRAVPKPASVAVKVADQPKLSLEQLRSLYNEVENTFGISGLSKALESVHQLESGKSNSTSRISSSGAVGPMQFLPSTFRHYCINTGAGCDITDLRSSAFAAGKLLADSYTWKGSWQGAFLNYNHSIAYANRALNLMNNIN